MIPYGQRQTFDFSGAIAAANTPQTLLPIWQTRSYLYIQNTSSNPLYIEIGPARATAIVSGGSVTSVSVTNAGIGYTYPPQVVFLGGAAANNNTGTLVSTVAAGLATPPPATLAVATPTVTSGSISAIAVNYGGAGYVGAPYVKLVNDPRDPVGVAAPSASVGLALAAGAIYQLMDMFITTEQISIFGGTTGQTFVCKAAL